MTKSVAAVVALMSLNAVQSQAGEIQSPLHSLFDREWEHRLAEDPLLATSVGRNEWNDLLPSVAAADHLRRATADHSFLQELRTIDRSKLSPTDLISYQIFERQLEDRIADFDFGSYEIPFNADSGFHTDFSMQPSVVPFLTVKDFENYISRLLAFPQYVDQQIEVMRQGLERGMSLPQIVLTGYEETIKPHLVERPEESVFFAPFNNIPLTIPQAEQTRLQESGRKAVMEGAVSGYQKFHDFFRNEYVPSTRTTLGASELPDGMKYYLQQIRHFTTLDLSPEEIHQIGLGEVDRIRREMDEIILQVKFEGSFEEFLAFLRSDPRFYPKSAEELLKEASFIAKRMDAKLPSLFKSLPRLPYGVAPVPDHIAPKYTAGRYIDAPPGGTQPGYYWVNTYALESRSLYTLEALTLHEAVPGHHLQGSLNQEQEDLPEFRRYSYISAFGEGWGLYSEWLGLEVGFYTDPYSNFGRLTYEMWRACRLVVDTGLHAMGWTRDQAIDYLASNTALSLHEVTTETDRYISWPGQALSYKLGELKIKELRSRAAAALGEAFDLRDFHDAVLRNGSVPLSTLEEIVEAYIASAQATNGTIH